MDMIPLVLASRNPGKIREIREMTAGLPVAWRSLNDYHGIPEIREDGGSYFENALRKARQTTLWTGEAALADDSGLEVDCLGGAPGIRSARYAGEAATDGDNIAKLLAEMQRVIPADRGARFRCVVVLHRPDGRHKAFEGIWRGRITMAPEGDGGFGYDPIFLSPEQGRTAAELSPAEKNRLSHRARAVAEFRRFWIREVAPPGFHGEQVRVPT